MPPPGVPQVGQPRKIPFGFPTGAAIGAVAGIAGDIYSNSQINKQNRQSERFSLGMYERQFSDNLEQWHRQNEYNSPQEQIKRLQQAGLNKALLYGGSSGQASGTADTMQGGQTQGAQFVPKELRAKTHIDNMMKMIEMRGARAQVSNLELQNTEDQYDFEQKTTRDSIEHPDEPGPKDNYNAHYFHQIMRDIREQNQNLKISQSTLAKIDQDQKAQKQIIDAYNKIPPNWRFIMNIIKSFIPTGSYKMN